MSINDRYLYRIADDIDRHGMGAVECDVETIVDHAHRSGITGAALSVVSDTREPEVARARAFGIVATRLWQQGRESADPLRVLTAIR
ncbi:MAG TPA: hypothetical protein VK923_03765 [Euzebyales bacterium]|nr:hypothetical protein [Euzebyales bacterium]